MKFSMKFYLEMDVLYRWSNRSTWPTKTSRTTKRWRSSVEFIFIDTFFRMNTFFQCRHKTIQIETLFKQTNQRLEIFLSLSLYVNCFIDPKLKKIRWWWRRRRSGL